ncbi:MAG: glycosyltransferase family 4 protein [Turicibacter sp.]|nr:glycosyltransferase family 4 protein [Turicibacter sp.]
MKILYCITRSDWGGAQVHMLDLITEMKKEGYACEVAIGEKGELYDRLEALGIPTHFVPALVHSINPILDVKVVYDLCKIIKGTQPDLVHLHSTKAGWVGRIASWLMKRKTIFTVHGWCFTEGVAGNRKKIGRFIETLLAPLAQKIICVSNFDKKLALALEVAPTQKIEVVYNGVRALEVQPKPLKSSKIKVIMVARFTDQKNQRCLIEAFAHVSPDFDLYLIGDGINLEGDQKRAVELGIKERIHFLGGRTDVTEILQDMDIFVLSSHYEGLPISIIEAMSLALPVIGSDVGGVNELISDGINGYLVKPDNSHQLAEKINNLNSPSKRWAMGQKSLEIFQDKFTLDKCVAHTRKIYENVLKGGH